MQHKLSPVMTGRLKSDLHTADGDYTIKAGTFVEFQFELDTPVVVVPTATRGQRSITASFKEVAGSRLT